MSKGNAVKDVLRVDAYGRLIRVALLFLMALGALALTAVAFALAAGAPPIRCLVPGVISAILVAVGLLAFDQTCIEVDGANRTLILREYLLGWRSEQMHKLHDFRGVTLVRYRNTSRRGIPRLYRIMLEPIAAGEQPLELMSEFAGAFAARRWLLRLSHATGLPSRIVDESVSCNCGV